MMRILIGISMLTLTHYASSAHAAEIFTWVDEQGKTHYSDQPPNQQHQAMALAELNVAEPPLTPTAKPKRPAPKLVANRTSARWAKSKPVRSGDRRLANRDQRAEECHKAEQRLRQVRNKRRTGYTASQGRKLKHQAQRHQRDMRFYCK